MPIAPESLDCAMDVVIVGAGLAGLAAANALHGLRMCVLEREPIAGGRVLTVEKGRAQLDLGACFAYNPHLLPHASAAPTARYDERDPIGIHMHGQLAFADSAYDALRQLPLSVNTTTALSKLRAGELQLRDLPPEAASIARALFQQIHPADMAEYSAARHGDAWHDWHPDHWHDGNGALIAAYAAPLQRCMRMRANVLHIRERADEARVAFEQDGAVREIRARAVIVATPATIARQLVRPLHPACAEFLRCVRYGRYTVVAFALAAEQNVFADPFRFIITPEAKMAFVMQQRHAQHGARVLLCYYGMRNVGFADAQSDHDLVEATAQQLMALGFAADVLETATSWVKRWPISGTVLDDPYFALKRPDFTRATRRVFLAGDYLSTTPGWGYGMDDAVASGRATGALVKSLLDAEL